MKISKIVRMILVLTLLNGCSSNDPDVEINPTSAPTAIPTETPSLSTPVLEENDTDRTPEKIINTLINNGWVVEKDYMDNNCLVYYGEEITTASPTNISYAYDINKIQESDVINATMSVHVNSLTNSMNILMSADTQSIIALKEESSMEACEYNFITDEYLEVIFDPGENGKPEDSECSDQMKAITGDEVENYIQWLENFGITYDDIIILSRSSYLDDNY